MPRRPRSQRSLPSPDDAESLFAGLLDDDIGASDDEAHVPGNVVNAGKSDIPPAVAPMTALDDPDMPFWLALNRVRGIGPARFRLLLSSAVGGLWERARRLAGDPSGLAVGGIGCADGGVASASAAAHRASSRGRAAHRVAGGALRTIDPAYPRLLQEIPLPPPVLYVRGSLAPQDEWALGIVGPRRATPYGKQMTEKLAGELARQNITIVSGLAMGIDTAAHHAALAVGGRTLAVLGCGPDLVYPPDNAKLAARIVEQGAILTEFPPGTQPEAGNFPARNRLISGLSLGVLVTEAPETSGALITTRFAAEQGRDIFAVPGNVTSRASVGANQLIQDGAKMVLEVGDILSELNLHLAPQQMEILELREALPENASEARLLALLDASDDAGHIDDLCRASGLPIAEVSGTLVMLELKGLVRLAGPMTYVKA